jgi:hypothetical protein
MRKFLVIATIFLCCTAAWAKKGTMRATRFIAENHPVFDCRDEDHGTSGMACDWNGTTGTNDAVALQSCIDAAAAAGKYGVAYIGQCRFYTGTTSIELNETVALRGCGSGSGWGASNAEADDACTLWVIDDAMTEPALFIRGDGANGKGFVGSTGDIGSEGVQVSGIKFISETVENAEEGIMLDGTYADEEVCTEPAGTCTVDGCTTGTNCRGSVRSVIIEDISCYKLGASWAGRASRCVATFSTSPCAT